MPNMTSRNWNTEIRRLEKERVLKFITSPTNQGKPLLKILAVYCQETGVSLKQLRIYIEEMRLAGILNFSEDDVKGIYG